MLNFGRFWIVVFVLSLLLWMILRRVLNVQIAFQWLLVISFFIATIAVAILWFISELVN